jgi:hypothetical protein
MAVRLAVARRQSMAGGRLKRAGGGGAVRICQSCVKFYDDLAKAGRREGAAQQGDDEQLIRGVGRTCSTVGAMEEGWPEQRVLLCNATRL